MKRLGLVLVSLFMVLSCVACGQTKEETKKSELKFTPGSYTASAQGYNGEVSIEATFSETAITDIPVSYTHLDVYKRQAQTSPLPVWLFADGELVQRLLIEEGLASVSISNPEYTYAAQLQAAQSQPVIARGSVSSVTEYSRRRGEVCLLYTSRCV